MKVAIVTNDGDFVSQHFGRSRYYKIYEIEDGQILNSKMRERGTGHYAQPDEEPAQPVHQIDAEKGHGFGADAQNRHLQMAAEIADCQVLIAGGMGKGAYESFQNAGLDVILTEYSSIEEAVTAFAENKIKNLYQERTD